MDEIREALLGGAMESAIYWGRITPDRFTVAWKVLRAYHLSEFVDALKITDLGIQALRAGYEANQLDADLPYPTAEIPVNPRVPPGYYEYHITMQAYDDRGELATQINDVYPSREPLSLAQLADRFVQAVESERYETITGTAGLESLRPTLIITRIVRGEQT